MQAFNQTHRYANLNEHTHIHTHTDNAHAQIAPPLSWCIILVVAVSLRYQRKVLYVVGSSRKPKISPGYWKKKMIFAWETMRDSIFIDGSPANIHFMGHISQICEEIESSEDLTLPHVQQLICKSIENHVRASRAKSRQNFSVSGLQSLHNCLQCDPD